MLSKGNETEPPMSCESCGKGLYNTDGEDKDSYFCAVCLWYFCKDCSKSHAYIIGSCVCYEREEDSPLEKSV